MFQRIIFEMFGIQKITTWPEKVNHVYKKQNLLFAPPKKKCAANVIVDGPC